MTNSSIGKIRFGLLASLSIPPLLVIPTMDLSTELASEAHIEYVSGYQTPAERAFLGPPSVPKYLEILPARDFKEGHRLFNGELWRQVKDGMEAGCIGIIVPPGVKGTRITRANAEIRNNYLLEIADALLVLSAPPESKTHALTLKALSQGLPVFTFEHTQHAALFDAGARVATIDAILAELERHETEVVE